MTDISIYAEGGGDSAQQKADLRRGLDGLLKNVKSKAQAKKMGWKLACCGGRQATYEAFINAVRTSSSAINILLVDSEDPIQPYSDDKKEEDKQIRVDHLTRRDKWDLTSTTGEHVHLMVQCMEAWIVADPEALEKYYGQHFSRKQLPLRQNLEEENKTAIYAALDRATSDKKISKGQYGKIKHASEILQLIDPTKVGARCPRFDILIEQLEKFIEEAA